MHPFSEQYGEYQKVSNYLFRHIMPELKAPSAFVLLCHVIDQTIGQPKVNGQRITKLTCSVSDLTNGTGIKDPRTLRKDAALLSEHQLVFHSCGGKGSKYIEFEVNTDLAIELFDAETSTKDAEVDEETSTINAEVPADEEDSSTKNVDLLNETSTNNVDVDDERSTKDAEVSGALIKDSLKDKPINTEPPCPSPPSAASGQAGAGEDQSNPPKPPPAKGRGKGAYICPSHWQEGDGFPHYVEAKDRPWWPEFCGWYKRYPRKDKPPDAWRGWVKIRRNDDTPQMLANLNGGLAWWMALWKKNGTPEEKIPHPASWLNGEYWFKPIGKGVVFYPPGERPEVPKPATEMPAPKANATDAAQALIQKLKNKTTGEGEGHAHRP